MVCKTSLSSMFRGIPITYDFIQSILGKPVTDNGKQIGVIIGVEPDRDTISMEIDDRYGVVFAKTQSLKIVGRR